MMLVLKTAPTQTDKDKILTLSECKSHMRILDSNSDTDISSYMSSAITEAQNITNRQFAKATYELYLEKFDYEISLPKNPIISVDSVEYMDEDAVYQTFDSTNYYFYEEHEVGKIHFETIPTHKDHKKAVKITFICGYESNFPDDLKQWLKVRTSTLNEYGEELSNQTVNKTNHVDKILLRYKIRSL